MHSAFKYYFFSWAKFKKWREREIPTSYIEWNIAKKKSSLTTSDYVLFFNFIFFSLVDLFLASLLPDCECRQNFFFLASCVYLYIEHNREIWKRFFSRCCRLLYCICRHTHYLWTRMMKMNGKNEQWKIRSTSNVTKREIFIFLLHDKIESFPLPKKKCNVHWLV